MAVAEDPTNGRYFHPKYMPKDEVEKDAFLDVAGARAASWAKAAKDEFYDRLKVKNNIPDSGSAFSKHNNAKMEQRMNITALGSKFESEKAD